MAWREPETLTCPGCGLTGEVTWVVGEADAAGQGGYRSLLDAGPWRDEPGDTLPNWHGRLLCPACTTMVKHIEASAPSKTK